MQPIRTPPPRSIPADPAGSPTDRGDVPAVLAVLDVMTADPVTVSPAATVKEIAVTMLARDLDSVPVVDVDDALVGVVTDADLVARQAYPVPRNPFLVEQADGRLEGRRRHWSERSVGVTAGEIMGACDVTCGPQEYLPIAVRRMLRHELRSMPVVENGRLVGVVSLRDALGLYERSDQSVAATVAYFLCDPLRAPVGHTATATVVDGVVELSGTVRRLQDRAVLVASVGSVAGVVEVVDRLTVTGAGDVAGPDGGGAL